MGYCSAIKKENGILLFATWMELECLEMSPSEKDTECMISLIRGV